MLVCKRVGVKEIAVSCPEGYEPDMGIVKETSTKVIRDPKEAVKDADVIYTDTWFSMGISEEEKEKRLKAFGKYQVNEKLVAEAKPDCIVMHCLPAHRGEEITDSVMDGKNSVVFDEAENRMHVQNAIMLWLLNSSR